MDQPEYQELLAKYKQKVQAEFGEAATQQNPRVSSREYTDFKSELYPNHYSLYEKACNFSANLLKLSVSPVKAEKTQNDLNTCHLNTTPSGVISFAILTALIIMIVGSMIAFMIPLMFGLEPDMTLVVIVLIAGAAMIPGLRKIPDFMANSWRMKASNQMVQSIFYVVTYMRHTSNLERAIQFSADHLEAPLNLDFRKILWDVETEQYSTIRESANAYLDKWKDFDKEFVEAFHLVESSLFESVEERRLALLDKSLDVILNGTYENMLHYAHELKGPMTMLHMLGVILPILGLVILPLVVSFMGSGSSPFKTAIYISFMYNVGLPLSVLYLGKKILSKRPAGYGAADISKKKGLKKLTNVNIKLSKKIVISVNPFYFSLMLLIIGLVIGLSPLVMHTIGVDDFDLIPGVAMLDYVCSPCAEGQLTACGPNCAYSEKIGPFGLGASLLSVFLVASIGVSGGLYYKLRSKDVIQIRERTKRLEDEFSSALFQLGNRLGDGLPGEIAFSKVAENMQESVTGQFFNLVEKNMTKLGMGLEQSIFDPKVGALLSFPSKVIESSMKVLVESIKKGPRIAANALLSMSRYIKEIHRVEERLKDLMSEIIASMKAQVKFLTPAIAGIVIGITSMISTILTKLTSQITETTSGAGADGGGLGGIASIFGIGMPTYHFQIIVGLYIVQIVYILTSLSNGIENGSDKLGERFALGKNLTKSTLSYCAIAAVVMVLFNLFARSILDTQLLG
jgi:Flp pilus assembly protein TadB